MKKNNLMLGLIPILFGFFVMGFVDVVGIATSYVQADFNLSESTSGFLPSMVFLWFLLLSVPTAIVMNRVGRKNTVLASMVVTFVGMLIPFAGYNLVTCLLAFGLLGIGNTILQVSLNPLVSNVVSGKALTSALTGGQVVKAVSSFLGPWIATYVGLQMFGDWKYIFLIYAAVTAISGAWLLAAPIEREKAETAASFGQTFGLLKDKTILLLFLGIVAVVGVDVGTNTLAPKLLMERMGLDPTSTESVQAVSQAPMWYFAFRTIGAFIGTWMLLKMNALKYFRIHIIGALAVVACLYFLQGKLPVLLFLGLIGYTCSSIFSVIFGMAMQARPEKANEISGLMITGVCGGAIVPPLMTMSTDLVAGNQNGALTIIGLAVCYLIYCSFGIKTSKA
ncbi:MAG: MFS transporter [Alistipes sp.]|nr:MFS transporter [Alistipes sp.]